MSEAYGSFAFAYDAALGERFFGAVVPVLQGVVASARVDPPAHLDLACGSGLALAWSAGEGLRSVGVDASLSMLGIARGRATELVAGDLRRIPLRGTFGLVTCLYDSLNHLMTRGDLRAAFDGVREVLAPRGSFVFDVNHPDVYPRIWGIAEPYVSRDAAHELSIETRWSAARGRGEAHVTGWARQGGTTVRIDEWRRQRAWSEDVITTLLRKSGLDSAEVIPFNPFDESDEHPAKLVFVVRQRL
ncbi:MAG: class I SAM-dependent DNA methyltransferase [Thermoanaerobaculia bacterium]